ncbi:MAG: hypothetical protein OXP71_15865 [Candidatus Poribacteria bacterium]|nr:hypothetical protein [Candidatus Poribacteria bacterium]
MRVNNVMFCLIALWGVFPFVRANTARADEEALINSRLASMFQKAKNFEEKHVTLSEDKAASVEKKIGAALLDEDRNPIFYIAYNEKKKPMGLVRFVKVKGPHGIISGGVALNMSGKVVKVDVYKHKESSKIGEEAFLSQFIGKGIDDKFKLGKDIKPVEGESEASQAVAMIPKKTLVMSYALFFKKKEKPKPVGDEDYKIEDLHALMHEMHESYILIREYFKTGENQADAVKAANQLWEYANLIADFEPPKNPNNQEEYLHLQKKTQDALLEFAESLEKDGVTEKTRKQWQQLLDVVNQAHLRFSVEEIDLDEDLKEDNGEEEK